MATITITPGWAGPASAVGTNPIVVQVAGVGPPGSLFSPSSMADSAASNNTVYYSTTQSKLVYKDGTGTVNVLY